LSPTKIGPPLLDWSSAGLQARPRGEYERLVTMDGLVQETNLAWALAEAVKPHLSEIERNHVFMAIGAGEAFAAIRGLLRSIAIKQIALRPDVVHQCTTWLRVYVGHRDEQYLRRLIEDYLMPYSIRIPASVRVNHRPTAPIPRQLVALIA
jgi:hypothetical protein